MVFMPSMYIGWSELTHELHEYVIITSDNETKTNIIYHGYLPGIY